MRWLSLLHRWIGAMAGLVLALIGLTGAMLVWRDTLTVVPHAGDPVRPGLAELVRVSGEMARGGLPIDRITFAGDGLGVHQIAYRGGSGAYASQTGEIVAHWSGMSARPELWLFDLHHRLLLGDAGETVTGIAGLIGLFFVVSGAVLWWRTRARFRPRPWPVRMTPGAIVHHHRDMGIVTAPLLLLSMLTGVMMALPGVGQVLLSPLGSDARAPVPRVPARHRISDRPDFAPLFRYAAARFPGAEPRRLQWPRKDGAPLALRLRQRFEWTPNGRTFVYFDPATMRPVGIADPATAGDAASVREKLYPLHAAKVGGLAWKCAMTLSGIVLALLGSLAVYGFWHTRWNVRRATRRKHTARVPAA
jgi:uncharacterized iron-regulated membrane protein